MADAIRFYTDEHFPLVLVKVLRSHGADVLTAHEAGMRGVSDTRHLAFPHAEQRVLITYDEDYLVLAHRGNAHAGIAYCHQDVPRARQVERLVLISYAHTPDEMAGRVEFL